MQLSFLASLKFCAFGECLTLLSLVGSNSHCKEGAEHYTRKERETDKDVGWQRGMWQEFADEPVETVVRTGLWKR